MNLSTMRTEARGIFGQPDANNSSITNTQLNGWALEFYTKLCVELEVLPLGVDAYDISGSTITLDSDTVLIQHVKFKIQPENKWVELEVKDLADMFRRDADWENAETGKPQWLVRTGSFTAMLYPPPNTANDSQTGALKVYMLDLPSATDLDGDSELPDLPRNLHNLFPYFMAYKALMTLQEYEKAGAQLALVNSGIKAQRNVSTKFSADKGWDWHDSEPGAVNWAS